MLTSLDANLGVSGVRCQGGDFSAGELEMDGWAMPNAKVMLLVGPPRSSLQVREGLGFRPLVIVVIGLIYSRYRAAKLSSTDLREDDAAAGGGGAGGGGGGGGGSRSGSPH